MNNPFQTGAVKIYEKVVTEADTAAFESGAVHPVYATFALARDAEWACRLFVLDMKEEDEEGIGTSLTVNHFSPALTGEKVTFTATLKSQEKNAVICSYEAKAGERLVASGETGQKVLKKSRLAGIFEQLQASTR